MELSPIRHWRSLLCCIATGLLLLFACWADGQSKIVPPPTREEWINRIDQQEGIRPLLQHSPYMMQASPGEQVLRLGTKADGIQLLSLHYPSDPNIAPEIAQRAQAPFSPIELGPNNTCQLALCLLVDEDTLWVAGAVRGTAMEEARLELAWNEQQRVTLKLSLLRPDEELYGFIAGTSVDGLNPAITVRLLTVNYEPLYETTLALPPS